MIYEEIANDVKEDEPKFLLGQRKIKIGKNILLQLTLPSSR